ncbi:hypothetical protein ACHAXR_004599 [Thalassiosira sp. AJA248-18]
MNRIASRHIALVNLLLRGPRLRGRPRHHLLSTAVVVDSAGSSDDAGASSSSSPPPSVVCQCPAPQHCPNPCSALLHIDRQHVLHPYTSMTSPLPTFPVKSAKGVHLTLNDGRTLIDGMSSWWAAVHGCRNPVLDQAMKEQIEDSMSHVMFGGLTHRPAVELAARLLQMVNDDYPSKDEETNTETEMDDSLMDFDLEKMQHEYQLTKVFFSDSGSISVEVAMKMAVQYWFTLQQTQKTKFISLRNGYHGDTMGAMSVCDPVNGMHSMFAGMLVQQLFVPSPTGPHPSDATETLRQMEIMLKQHHHEVAAVIVEPIVQGAGGMKFYHPVVLKKLRKLCDEYGVLLIFDEIATGFGRTGTLFAGWQGEGTYKPWSSLDDKGETDSIENSSTENHSITFPDILCLGKALTGGYMTLGATLTTDKLAHGISDTGGVFMHGPTFMANPLACSVSLASINLLMRSPWKERVRKVEKALIKHLSPLADLDSIVREVRVLGAIGVCEMREGLDRDGMARVQRQLVEEGVWLRPFGKLLYCMPPFNCEDLEDGHMKKIGDAIYKVASKI